MEALGGVGELGSPATTEVLAGEQHDRTRLLPSTDTRIPLGLGFTLTGCSIDGIQITKDQVPGSPDMIAIMCPVWKDCIAITFNSFQFVLC